MVREIFYFFFSIIRCGMVVPDTFGARLGGVGDADVNTACLVGAVCDFLLLGFYIRSSASSMVISNFAVGPAGARIEGTAVNVEALLSVGSGGSEVLVP